MKQTEELFKNGYVTSNGGRGRAYAQGTAFSNGSDGGLGPVGGKPVGNGTIINNTTNNYNYNSSKSSSSKSNSTSSAAESAEEFSETLDWIEVLIDRIERALDNLDTVASSVYTNWSERNAALNEAMNVTRQEIELQQRAYDRYMQEAANTGLSADWMEKVQNGMIDIQTITDETLHDQIQNYQEWYLTMPIYLAINI